MWFTQTIKDPLNTIHIYTMQHPQLYITPIYLKLFVYLNIFWWKQPSEKRGLVFCVTWLWLISIWLSVTTIYLLFSYCKEPTVHLCVFGSLPLIDFRFPHKPAENCVKVDEWKREFSIFSCFIAVLANVYVSTSADFSLLEWEQKCVDWTYLLIQININSTTCILQSSKVLQGLESIEKRNLILNWIHFHFLAHATLALSQISLVSLYNCASNHKTLVLCVIGLSFVYLFSLRLQNTLYMKEKLILGESRT